MAVRPSGKKKARIRKAPTVRQQIERRTAGEVPKPRKKRRAAGNIRKFLAAAWKPLRWLLSPLAPAGRVIVRVLRWLTPSYFVNSWRELRQVTWPNRRETWRLTGAVLVFAIIFGGMVAIVDKGLDELFQRVILR